MKLPVITLLTDLGASDASVALAKAVLINYAPHTPLADISHLVSRFDLQQAAYLLSSAYAHFPAGAVNIVAIDVFRGNAPAMLLAAYAGYYFICPNNGFLPLAFGENIQDIYLCCEFSKPYIFKEWMNKAGQVIETLTKDATLSVFSPHEIKKASRILQPKEMADGIECNVLYIDHYENVALDITRKQFDDLVNDGPFRIRISRTQWITAISHNYNDVGKEEALCRFNAAGYMEIAVNQGKAATLLGLGAYQAGNLQYQTIKIQF
jgi:S-adenosylmethionine hydrolase